MTDISVHKNFKQWIHIKFSTIWEVTVQPKNTQKKMLVDPYSFNNLIATTKGWLITNAPVFKASRDIDT